MFEIYIPVVNNPEFIELQYECFKKFCKDDWKMIIFNDTKWWPEYSNFNDTTLKKKIRETCEKLGIEHHFVPNEHHRTHLINASERHCSTINWIFGNFVSKSINPILVFDSDMFLIKEFSISKWIENDFVGCFQKREHITYLWPNLFYFQSHLPDKEKINWNILVDKGINTDTGGCSYHYLQNHPNLKGKQFGILSSLNWNKKSVSLTDLLLDQSIWDFLEGDIKNVDGKYWCEIYDDIFLHYRAGSNWEGLSKEIHQKRIKALTNCLKNLLIY